MKRLALTLLAFVACATPALADPTTADVGLTLNPIVGGVHESYNDRVHVPPVPVPLIEAHVNHGPFELYAISLPPLAAVPYNDSIQGHTSTVLSTLDIAARIYGPNHRLWIGAGETIYNQTTHYARAREFPYSPERQYSRVVGGDYEVGWRAPFRSGALETTLRLAPVMHGTQVTAYEGYDALTRYDPENGRQVDASVRYVRDISPHATAILSLRYVNFGAYYVVPSRPLSDRNVGLLPGFGYRLKL